MDKKLDERLFWLGVYDGGYSESYHLLTAEQLRDEFEGEGIYDVDKILKEGIPVQPDGDNSLEGYIDGDDVLGYLREVQSLDELKDLMTWKDVELFETEGAEEREFDYPDFVHENLRHENYVRYLDIKISEELPMSEDDNPTVRKYLDVLGLDESTLTFEPTDEERAAMEVADVLNESYEDDGEELTEEGYNEICGKYGLSEYAASAGQAADDDFEAAVAGIKSSDNSLNQ